LRERSAAGIIQLAAIEALEETLMKRESWRIVAIVASVLCVLSPSWTRPVLADDEVPKWKSLERDAKRAKIDDMAQQALEGLFARSVKAESLFQKAYGWAVFDNLKLAMIISGGGGNGVAVDKGTGDRTYMKMGTAGIGFGIGGQTYQVIMFFQDKGTFVNFVENGWQADAGVTAAAGTEGVNPSTGFVNGLAIFKVTGTGLMANADIAGTKYWKNKKLNH
jgi:lipid-binding SYLF domain-containing protein